MKVKMSEPCSLTQVHNREGRYLKVSLRVEHFDIESKKHPTKIVLNPLLESFREFKIHEKGPRTKESTNAFGLHLFIFYGIKFILF